MKTKVLASRLPRLVFNKTIYLSSDQFVQLLKNPRIKNVAVTVRSTTDDVTYFWVGKAVATKNALSWRDALIYISTQGDVYIEGLGGGVSKRMLDIVNWTGFEEEDF